MNKVYVLYAALFCAAALSAQEAAAPSAPAAEPAAAEPAAAEPVTAPAPIAAEPVTTVPAEAEPIIPAPTVTESVTPAPAAALTRADSALSVYRSARDSIIAANRKFPRPPKPRYDDTARAPKTPDSALASADEAIRAAWEAMGVRLPPREEPPTAALPRGPDAQARESALPPLKPFKAQAALGLITPINFGGEPNFKPWWSTAFYISYRNIDADAQFSKGVNLDLSLYFFNRKKYEEYYEDKRDSILISGDASMSMLIIDLGYYLKYYPVDQIKIPYVSASANVCGTFYGGANVSYKEGDSVVAIDEPMENDVYLFGASVGVGVDIPVYAGIKAFAEIHYSLRFGLNSLFDEDGKFLGGLVPQMPIRFGVMIPFGL